MRRLALLAPILVTMAASQSAEAHITLEYPAPRTDSQKIGPCGADGIARGPHQTFSPGETITVQWDETVDHPGHYRIAFDIDGEEFELPNNPNDNFPNTLVDQIDDRQGGGKYSQQITFPDVECDNCTLQLIQVMTTNVPYNSFYFQCSDIVLRGQSSGGADAGPGGGDDGGDASGGCGCATGDAGSGPFALLALGLCVLGLRRRR